MRVNVHFVILEAYGGAPTYVPTSSYIIQSSLVSGVVMTKPTAVEDRVN